MNILNNNGKYHFFNALTIEQTLRPTIYLFNFDGQGNCWLEDVESFKFPEKIYDVNADLRSYIKKSYEANQKNLGILLTGNKGQGKSLTAKLICTELEQPTIIINKRIPSGINFVNFFNQIKQNYTLFVDEFEKLFDTKKNSDNTEGYHTQESFLSFMDGVFTNEHKIVFLLTTNETVNEYFINRPSRIKFLQEYSELPEELFDLITDDKLKNSEFKEDLELNISLVNLNIDLLISIIDDINLFNKPFSTFKELYNYKFEQYKYEIHSMTNGVEKYENIVTTMKKFKYTDHYIGSYRVLDMIKFTSDEIVFKTSKWTTNKKDEDIEEEVLIKVTPYVRVGTNKYVM